MLYRWKSARNYLNSESTFTSMAIYCVDSKMHELCQEYNLPDNYENYED